MTRKPLLIAFLVALSLVAIGIIGIAAAADAEQVDDVSIHGISYRDNAVMKIGIDENTLTAYKNVTWFIYTPAAVTVTHTDGVVTFSEDIAAGYHEYAVEYELGRQLITWTIGDLTFDYTLRVTDRTMVEETDPEDNYVRVDPDFISEQERNVAVGAMLAALAPALFIIPYWKSKKQEGWENAFE